MRPPFRRLGSLAAVALLALMAGCTTQAATLEPPQEWSRQVPAKYGKPLDSRIAEGTVLITTTLGLIGMDPLTGAEKWWRDFSSDFSEGMGGEMSRGIALFEITVAGDAVVVTRSPENTPGNTGRHGREVLDLATGSTRFKVNPETTSAEGWFFVHVTKTAIIAFNCVDLVECDITSHALNDGAQLWTINLPGGRVDLPDQLSWSQERGYSSDGQSPSIWKVSEEPEFALVNNHKTDTATTVDLDTGKVIGEWKRADTRAWYVLVGPTVVEIGAGDVLRGLDPATGEERWQHTLLGAATSTPFGYHGLLVTGNVLVDESESSSGRKDYQFVDLLTGPKGPPQTAPEPQALVVTTQLLVTTDLELSTLTATDTAGGQHKWTAELPDPDNALRLGESVLAGKVLVISATLSFDEPGALHAVNTATGSVRTWPGEYYLGNGDGLMIAMSGDDTAGYSLHSHWL